MLCSSAIFTASSAVMRTVEGLCADAVVARPSARTSSNDVLRMTAPEGTAAPAKRSCRRAPDRRSLEASSNSEYATGVTSSVRSNASDWPPKMTKPIA